MYKIILPSSLPSIPIATVIIAGFIRKDKAGFK